MTILLICLLIISTRNIKLDVGFIHKFKIILEMILNNYNNHINKFFRYTNFLKKFEIDTFYIYFYYPLSIYN